MHALICRESVGGSRREREFKHRCFILRISYPQMIRCSHEKMPPKYQLNSDAPGTQLLPSGQSKSEQGLKLHTGRGGMGPWGQRREGKRTAGRLFQGEELGTEQLTRLWGAGQQRPRHRHLLLTWFLSFKSKPFRWPWQGHDKYNKETFLPFSSLFIFSFPSSLSSPSSSKCPVSLPLILSTHQHGNHRHGCLQHREKPAGINFNLASADKRLGAVCLGLPASLTAPFI